MELIPANTDKVYGINMRIKAIGGEDPSDQTKTIITRMFAQVKDQNGDWNREQSIPLDLPSFYKNYTDLNSLASALGVGKVHTSGPQEFNNDCDNAGYGIWDCYGGSSVISNYPSTSGGILISDDRDAINKWQMVMEYEGKIFYRSKRYNSAWSGWYPVSLPYLAPYSDLSSLASALGGIQEGRDEPTDVNTINITSIRSFSTVQHRENDHWADPAGGFCLTICNGNAYRIQFFSSYTGGTLFYRTYWQTQWFEWHQIY